MINNPTTLIAGPGIVLSGPAGAVTISTSSGTILQTVYGDITSASSNSQIPYDNTPPLITQGFEIWTRTFTPVSPTSLILITTSSFYAVSSSSNVHCSIAYFSGSTNIFAQSAGFTTDNGETNSFNVLGSEIAGSVATRTYSCRMGPSISATVFVAQGTGGQAFGSATNSGRYIIQEIAV